MMRALLPLALLAPRPSLPLPLPLLDLTTVRASSPRALHSKVLSGCVVP